MLLYVYAAIVFLVVSYFVGDLAAQKNRGFALGFLLCILLSPIGGYIVVQCMPDKKPKELIEYRKTRKADEDFDSWMAQQNKK
jgi:hypothetical protein